MNKRIYALLFSLLSTVAVQSAEPVYVRKATRQETLTATLKANGLPTLQGKWYWIGPFDNRNNAGFLKSYPPEKKVDLKATYIGKTAEEIRWNEFKDFSTGKVVNLARFRSNNDSVVYLYHEFQSPKEMILPLSLGSDDTLTVWLNDQRVFNLEAYRAAAPDQDEVKLKLQEGTNRLLVKVCNAGGEFAVYIQPEFPKILPARVRKQLDRNFPQTGAVSNSLIAAEAQHYQITTLPVPEGIVLEVGGLAVRPDGKLLACTRRGDIWLISHPDTEDLDKIEYQAFAKGLHEALGMYVEDNQTVYVVQRPELTKLVDKDNDGRADWYETICDRWGVSGDYHEFAFGPARDKDGNFYVTLNVGFGGGHQAKGAWRGWCVKITPEGRLEPFATGLRSPNGVNFSPEGDLFYCDNQGEWVASNKMHHIRKGEFYGHQAGLRWLDESPFAKSLPANPPQGMRYDEVDGKKPQLTPPCIWFPYGRMGQSVSEPIWDTTSGKFGPFAGQCLVGDQTKSMIMRVALEKVNNRYQGACFPFRSGFQCGINRLAFGPNGNLYVGETNRGWGSVGGKPYGLERLTYTGELPFEIHTMSLTKGGFALTFTKPVDRDIAAKPDLYNMTSFTYVYSSQYGYPETDRRAETVSDVRVSEDGRQVSFRVDSLKTGRVYELRVDGLQSADGDPILHADAYYTLNHLR